MGSFNLGLPPNNGAGFFDPVKEALASDLVMGNLETPLSDPTGYSKCGDPPSDGCFQFSVPPSYANHLRDGGFQVGDEHVRHIGAYGHDVTFDGYRMPVEATSALLEEAGFEVTATVVRSAEDWERTPQAYLVARRR